MFMRYTYHGIGHPKILREITRACTDEVPGDGLTSEGVENADYGDWESRIRIPPYGDEMEKSGGDGGDDDDDDDDEGARGEGDDDGEEDPEADQDQDQDEDELEDEDEDEWADNTEDWDTEDHDDVFF
jgi:hypothetical protein